MRSLTPLVAVVALACSDAGITKYNSDPDATILSPSDGDVVEAEVVQYLRGQVGDPNHPLEELKVTWLIDGEERCDESTPNEFGEVACEATFGEDGGKVQLEVRDPEGASDVDQITVTVEPPVPPNGDPSCAITAPESGAVGAQGELVVFTGTASDPDERPDALSVEWSSDKDGPIGASTPTSEGTVSFPYSDLSADTHAVTMTVTDSAGATCTADTLFTVATPPALTVTAPEDGAVLPFDAPVLFEATVADNEDAPDDVDLSWVSDRDGVFSSNGADSAGTASVVAEDLSAGDHIISVTATDTHGLFVTETLTLTLNQPPAVDGVTISPDPAHNDDTLTCTATATDADGDTPALSYAWSDGTTGPTLALSSDTASPGDTFTCTATATDETGTASAGTASITLSNRDPEGVAVITPDPPTRLDTLTCAVTDIVDPDGDALSVDFAWTINDAPAAATASPTASALSDAVSAGDVIVCTATVTDEHDGSVTLVASTVVLNTGPELTSVTLTPEEVYTNDTVTAVVTASDPDGDTLSYRYAFYVDDVNVQDGSSNTLDGVVHFDKGQSIRVEATVSDAESDDTASAGPVTVLNSPPTAPVVSITVEQPCPDGWSIMADGARCVTVVDSAGFTWFEARDACEDEGGALVSVLGEADNDQVLGLSAGFSANSIWIGYTDLASEGDWEWVDGDPETYENWRTAGGEPNGGTVENCAELYHPDVEWSGYAGYWNDAPCEAAGHTGGFACQTDAAGTGGAVQWRTEDGGNGHWYAVRSAPEGLTWSEAHAAAEDEGGHLVTLTSAAEDTWVYETFLTDSALWMIGEAHARGPYIGLYETGGAFEWVTGESSAYFNWVSGDPNGAGPDDVGSFYNRSPSPGHGWSDEDFTSTGEHYIVEWTSLSDIGLICVIDEHATDADDDPISYVFDWDVDGSPFSDTDTVSYDGDAVPSDALGIDEIWTCTVTPQDDEDDGAPGTASTETLASLPSCAAWLEAGFSEDGVYPIDPDGGGSVEALEVYCDMTAGGWTLVANIYDSAEDDAPNDPGYVVSGWQQTGPGAWTAASRIDLDHGAGSSAAAPMETVEALVTDADQAHIKICLVHRDGWNVDCLSSDEDTLFPTSYLTGSPTLTAYADEPLVYTFGRLAGHPGSSDAYDGYSFDEATTGWGIGKAPISVDDEFGWADWFHELGGSPDTCNSYGVWHANGNGISYHPEQTNNNELGNGGPGCSPIYEPDPSPNSWGFRLYIGPPVPEDDCVLGDDAACPALDCADLQTARPDAESDVYWIQPVSDVYPAYCNMDTDGGGWTLVMKAVDGNFAYDDPVWTTEALFDETDLDPTAAGEAKYQSFNEVPFTEMLTTDPDDFGIFHSESFDDAWDSSLEFYSAPPMVLDEDGYLPYFNDRTPAYWGAWGCAEYDRYGFNLYESLGCTYIAGGMSCDHNGGARWGNRINGWYEGDGNITGHGWANYSCGRSDMPSVDTGTPEVYVSTIRELMWVR